MRRGEKGKGWAARGGPTSLPDRTGDCAAQGWDRGTDAQGDEGRVGAGPRPYRATGAQRGDSMVFFKDKQTPQTVANCSYNVKQTLRMN